MGENQSECENNLDYYIKADRHMKFIIYAILTQRARAENLKKSICHFLTNRKRPFFRLANRRIFVYTFCLINICLSLSDDANEIKTLNIERA